MSIKIYIHINRFTDLAEMWYFEIFWILITNMKSDVTSENFKNLVIRKHMEW